MKKNNRTTQTTLLVYIAVLVAQGMVLSFVESLLPVPFIAPGAKLGLANIITVTSIYLLPFSGTLAVVFLKVILMSVTFGSLSSLLYSLAGGLLSLFAMMSVKKLFKDEVSIIGISVMGAVAHNVGQVAVAAVLIESTLIFMYLPILLLVAIPTGLFVGIVSKMLISYLNRI